MPGWSVVVAVKPLERAKTRLEVAQRSLLVLAMALDTVSAAHEADGVRRVVAVSNDAALRAALAEARCACLPDEPDRGLNAALRHGAAWARAVAPGDGVAALAADLPALRGEQLAAALAAASGHGASVVADQHGRGTTMYAARAGACFEPRFGADSFARHVAAGAHPLPGLPAGGLSHDVDTVEDLWAAAELGLGPHTRGLLDRLAAAG